MAIVFRDRDSAGEPAKKEVGKKTFVAEEPTAKVSEEPVELPFGKPVRPEKKGRKK